MTVRACVRACACACVLMYKRSEHEHMGRVGVFWQRTATLPPFTTKAGKKMLYFISASEIFNTSLKIRFVFSLTKENGTIGCPFEAAKESMNTWCKWVVPKTSPPLCPQRISRFIRRLNYRVTAVELQELQNSEGQVLILFYWSSCFLRKTLYWTFICLFSLERSDKQRKKEEIRTVGAHTPCKHTLPITSWLLSECKVNHRSRQYLCQTLWPWRIDGRFVEPWQQSSVNPADEKSVFVLHTNWLVNSCMVSSVIAEKKLPAQCR